MPVCTAEAQVGLRCKHGISSFCSGMALLARGIAVRRGGARRSGNARRLPEDAIHEVPAPFGVNSTGLRVCP